MLKIILKASIQLLDMQNSKTTSTKPVKIFYNTATLATDIFERHYINL